MDVFIDIKLKFGQIESKFSSEICSNDEFKSNWSLNDEKNEDWDTLRYVDLVLSSCVNGNDKWWENFVVELFRFDVVDDGLFNLTHFEHCWFVSIISVMEYKSFSKSAVSSKSDVWPVRAAIWLSISIFAASTFSGKPAISKTGSLSRPGVTIYVLVVCWIRLIVAPLGPTTKPTTRYGTRTWIVICWTLFGVVDVDDDVDG